MCRASADLQHLWAHRALPRTCRGSRARRPSIKLRIPEAGEPSWSEARISILIRTCPDRSTETCRHSVRHSWLTVVLSCWLVVVFDFQFPVGALGTIPQGLSLCESEQDSGGRQVGRSLLHVGGLFWQRCSLRPFGMGREGREGEGGRGRRRESSTWVPSSLFVFDPCSHLSVSFTFGALYVSVFFGCFLGYWRLVEAEAQASCPAGFVTITSLGPVGTLRDHGLEDTSSRTSSVASLKHSFVRSPLEAGAWI